MSLSDALKKHLDESAENGSRLAILFAQIALFIATIFVQKTRLYVEHDSTGFKTGLSYQIIAIVVSNSRRLSGLGFIRITSDYKVNSLANLICLDLALVLEKFYEKSLSSLGFALSVSVLFLILLVIIRPSTDFGLFDFLIGVIASVAYNLFGLKFQTWMVVAICFPLLIFRCWLEKNWLEVGEYQSLTTDRSTGGRNQICKLHIIEELTVGGFHIFWVYNLFRINCRRIKGPAKSISCTSSSIIMGMPVCLLIFNLWFGVALIPRVYSLCRTDPEELSRREGRIDPGADPESLSRQEGRIDPDADPEALSRQEGRTDPGADPESLSRREGRIDLGADPEALSRREGRIDPEADPKALSRREGRIDLEALSRRGVIVDLEAYPEAYLASIIPPEGNLNNGPGAGCVNEGPFVGAANPGADLRKRARVYKQGPINF